MNVKRLVATSYSTIQAIAAIELAPITIKSKPISFAGYIYHCIKEMRSSIKWLNIKRFNKWECVDMRQPGWWSPSGCGRTLQPARPVSKKYNQII